MIGDTVRPKYLYPCYFDASITRKEGRRVSKSEASAEPKIRSIVLAAKKLALDPVPEKKSHPAYWLKGEGRVAVEYSGSKEELLHKIAAKMKEEK